MKNWTIPGCRVERFSDRADWLDWRGRGIGGTDASTILGCNPWQTKFALWVRLITGRRNESADNAAMKRGRDLEPLIRREFAIDYESLYSVQNPPAGNWSFVREDKPWMRASLDGLIKRKSDGALGILEIKTAGRTSSEWEGKIPDYYYAQCIHYAAVTGAKFVILRARIEDRDFNTGFLRQATINDYYIDCEEKERDIRALVSLEERFWEDVRSGKAPRADI